VRGRVQISRTDAREFLVDEVGISTVLIMDEFSFAPFQAIMTTTGSIYEGQYQQSALFLFVLSFYLFHHNSV